jgi:transcriptional regulator with GAF, ATPase, and Fis domain
VAFSNLRGSIARIAPPPRRDEVGLWRQASLAADVEGFFARAGVELLDQLGATAIAVRALDREHDRLDTIAMVRHGALGVATVAHPRHDLDGAATERIATWIESGAPERASATNASPVARDVLRGLVESLDDSWWLAPLGPLGVLIVAGACAIDRRALAEACEPIAAVMARAKNRRELEQMREAAEADKEAALARLQLRDMSVAIVGEHAGLRDVMRQVEQVAPTPTPVLVYGETGSGKEVVARAIHERSRRARGPVLRVNCGAIAPELVDSELFGHERGSFTGAATQRHGWFERADGGTLFLDEIAELPLAAQVRLLRVLQDGVFERVGGTRSLQVDVRVVAATHRDLADMVRRGLFREDLWYRINVFVIRLPPLRQRRADIAALAAHFAERAARRFGVAALHVSAAQVAMLESYGWPGNVRELAAVIERAAILGEGRGLDIERALGVQPSVAPAHDAGDRFPTLDEAMRHHIERALARTLGRVDGQTGAARLLGLHPNTLRSRMNKLGVRRERFR